MISISENKRYIISAIVLLVLLQAGLLILSLRKEPEHLEKNESAGNDAALDVNAITEISDRLPADEHLTVPFPEGIEKEKDLDLVFFGDMMLDRHVGKIIAKNGLESLFADIAKEELLLFKDADLLAANLEGAVTDRGAHYAPEFANDFAFAPDLAEGLKKYGFSFLNIANNHLADQGDRGIIETRKNLSESGFVFSGCKDRESGECSAAIMEISGKKIGLAGFSMVYGTLDQEQVLGIVKGLASSTDLVIVNMHWGVEYEHAFNPVQQKLARALIDAGADLIVGHHPHVVQGMEIYRSKAIFYSLGNFIFDQYFSPDTQEGLAIGVAVSGEKISLSLFPLQSQQSRPAPMEGRAKEKFLQEFAGWSVADMDVKERIKEGFVSIE